MTDVADNLAQHVRRSFEDSKTKRTLYEQEWLRNLRQYLGIYDPEIEGAIPPDRSKAFVRLTRTKVKTMDARLRDMMFPAGTSRNWSLQPAPSEDEAQPMAPEQTGALRRMVSRVLHQFPADHAGAKALNDAVERMSQQINDQLNEAHYKCLARKAIHSGNLYGTGILKGPLVERHQRGAWVQQNGVFVYAAKAEFRPYLGYVRVWDLYPDMSATSVEDCEYFVERHVMSRPQVRKLTRRPGFDRAKIEAYLADHLEGDAEYTSSEVQLRVLNEKQQAESKRGKRYEVLEFWGTVSGQDLLDCGCEIDQALASQDFEANVWVLGDQVIKAALHPYDAKLKIYHFYYFEEDETSVFGVGIPAIMRDTQMVFNACVRATIDNAAMSAGPLTEVNMSLLAPGEDPDGIYPWRNFVRTGVGQEALAPAVRSYTVANNVPALLALAQAFKEMGDEATAIPAYIQGEGVAEAGRTVGGLSMLMGAANITLKDTTGHFDDGVTKPLITGMYHWNMQFHPDPTIKGNFEVVVRGSESLVAKEIRAKQLEALAAETMNPADAVNIDRRALLKERLRANELNDELLMVDEETAKQELAKLKSMPNREMLDFQVSQLKIAVDKFKAVTAAQSDQAKIASNERIKGAELALKARAEQLAEREAAIQAREDALDRLAKVQAAQFQYAEPTAETASGTYFPPPNEVSNAPGP